MSSDKWPEPEIEPLPNRYLRLSLIFVGLVSLGLLGVWVFGTADPVVATVGQAAPEFEVRNVVRDEPLTLQELVNEDGRPIVINLMASWCGPCRAEIPELSAFADANPHVSVIGVAVEDRYEDFKQFVTEVAPSYPVAFDDGAMRARYQTLGLPGTFFLDSSGRVVDIFNGVLNQEILEEMIDGIS
jgi:thiol-disulfide isomerase/thioredoxin